MNINVHQILEDSRTSGAKGHPDYNVTKLAKIWIKMNILDDLDTFRPSNALNGMIEHVTETRDGVKTTWSWNRELENWFGWAGEITRESSSVTLLDQ